MTDDKSLTNAAAALRGSAEEAANQLEAANTELQKKDTALQKKDTALQEKDAQLQQKETELEGAERDKSTLEDTVKTLQAEKDKITADAEQLKLDLENERKKNGKITADAEQLKLALENERKEKEDLERKATEEEEFKKKWLHQKKFLLKHMLEKELTDDTAEVADETVLIKILCPPPGSPDDFPDTFEAVPQRSVADLSALKKVAVGKHHLIVGRKSGVRSAAVLAGGLSLEDENLSGFQAVVFHDGDSYVWKDLGSSYGSTAFFPDPFATNGIREVKVEPGDSLELESGMLKVVGNCVLYILLGKTTDEISSDEDTIPGREKTVWSEEDSVWSEEDTVARGEDTLY